MLWLLFSLYVPRPFHPPAERIQIEITPGTTLGEAARLLSERRLLPSVSAFVFLGYLRGVTDQIKAGTYELPLPIPPARILARLSEGRVKLVRVSIPEGYNMYQITDILVAAGINSREEFLSSARDPVLIRELNLEGDSLEGYLYPDTYYFAPGIHPAQVIRTMVGRFREVFQPLWEEASAEAPPSLSPREVVILASLIEKETSLPSERPLISAVFINRLRSRMRMDCDPTVIYGIWNDFDGNLRRSDLTRRHPYNTYRIRGLPPGPIANPGRESLFAALHPASAPYRYFVSRNDGSHKFSITLAEHNRAVNTLQRSRRRR